MNIEIVNKQTAKATGCPEKDVALVNKFYWNTVVDHVYSFSPYPIDIYKVCVIYPNKYYIKYFIKEIIRRIKNIRVSPKYKEGSVKQLAYLKHNMHVLTNALKIRKFNKFTN